MVRNKNNDKFIDKDEEHGNRNASLDVLGQTLGKNIRPIQEIRKKDTTLLRFVEPSEYELSRNRTSKIAGTADNPIFYEYDIEENKLTIYYGLVNEYKTEIEEDSEIKVFNFEEGTFEEKNYYIELMAVNDQEIVIEDFKDGDYNLDLNLDKYIFQGSRREQGDEDSREYKIDQNHYMI